MPVSALVAAAKACSGERNGATGLVAAGVGIGCIAGTLVEPATYRRRAWKPVVRTAIAVNVVTSAALVAAGLRHAATAGSNPDGIVIRSRDGGTR
jgi:hypothetical protein